MTTHETLLFLHLLSVGLLIGGEGVAMATGIGMSRTSDTKTLGMLAGLSVRAERFALIPGAIGAIVFGTWLVDEAGHDFGDTWLVVAYVLWAIAFVVGAFVLGPHGRRVAKHAAILVEDGVAESDELRAEAAQPTMTMLGMLEAIIIVAFLWLMTAKPGA